MKNRRHSLGKIKRERQMGLEGKDRRRHGGKDIKRETREAEGRDSGRDSEGNSRE